MNLSIAQALRTDSSPCVAFVGAGGKTTALFQLARQLTSPVIVTATSHLGAWQFSLADRHITTEAHAIPEELEHGLQGVTLITGSIHGDRSNAANTDLLYWLHQLCSTRDIPLLIEADGSRQKPLKAWAKHEPPVPDFVKHVVHVVGLSALGQPLTEEVVHRSEIYATRSGLNSGDTITAEAMIRVLIDGEGGLKNIPGEARKTVLLNQADSDALQATANGMAPALLARFDSVVISSLKTENIQAAHERIAAIILAAGQSTRYGQAKQLLDWRGIPFVRAVAQTALEAGLSPVIVVTGAKAEKVGLAVNDLNVRLIHNGEWKRGQGSSIKTGIQALQPASHLGSPAIGGAIFLLADQPQVTTSILRALLEKHAQALYAVVAPMVLDQRANPVLFDRSTFQDLTSIEGDVGGRAIFHKHRVEYLPWHDERLLMDVDTPEMYQRLIADETL